MKARLRQLLAYLVDAFWLLPAVLTLLAVVLAVGLVEFDRNFQGPDALRQSAWLYNGGGTGARTLLGAVAGSAIGVAGTVFSITIAALSLASGQMGPRLLRSFMRDRGNQVTLGMLLGTFTYALMVLRSVRTTGEGEFTPHLAMSVGILLAFGCVIVLIYFVGHIAGRINVETVIELVAADLRRAMKRLSVARPSPPEAAPEPDWTDAVPVIDTREGYLQHLDAEGLADWAAERRASVQLLIRPGHYLFPQTPVAYVRSAAADAALDAVRNATAIGSQRVGDSDPEFAIRQLVEVAMRALSPGIHDPFTAISVLDRLGGALCGLRETTFPTGRWVRDGRVVLVAPVVDYAGLVDAMFHGIRQSAAGQVSVLIRLLEVLTAVANCEQSPERQQVLRRHADLAFATAIESISSVADRADVRERYNALESTLAAFRRQPPVAGSDGVSAVPPAPNAFSDR